MIGDLLKREDPGHSRIVKYKTWVARANKYQPGLYPFKDRRDSGLWEYVLTMRNVLVALEKPIGGGRVARVRLSPGKVAEFPPEALRSWELPPEHEEARGCTLLWSGRGAHTDEGLGGFQYGFCFESWTPATVAERLHRPFNNRGLQVQYVEVFNGSLRCMANQVIKSLGAGDFLYVRADVPIRFEAETAETYGSVLYYKQDSE